MKYNVRNYGKQFHEQCLSHVQVQRMANETGLDFSDQIISLENKYQQVGQLTFYLVIFLN